MLHLYARTFTFANSHNRGLIAYKHLTLLPLTYDCRLWCHQRLEDIRSRVLLERLPSYYGEEVCAPRYDPKSYAGGSLSSWQGHPSQTGQRVRVRRRVVHWTSRLGVVRLGWYPTPIKNIITHKLPIKNRWPDQQRRLLQRKRIRDSELLNMYLWEHGTYEAWHINWVNFKRN